MGKAGRRAELEASAQRLIEADRQNDLKRIEFLNVVAEYLKTKYRSPPLETKQFVDEIVSIGQFSLSKAMQEANIAPSNMSNISKSESNQLFANADKIARLLAQSQYVNNPEKGKDSAGISTELHGFDKRHVDDAIALRGLEQGKRENEASP
jgi:hypothetical protein